MKIKLIRVIQILALVFLFIPIVFPASEDKTAHLYGNATVLHQCDLNITQDNSTRLFVGENKTDTDGVLHDKNVKRIKEGSCKYPGLNKNVAVWFPQFFNGGPQGRISDIFNISFGGMINTSSNGLVQLITMSHDPFMARGFILRYDDRGGEDQGVICYVQDNSDNIATARWETSAIEDGNWHLVACQINQTGSRLCATVFVNGTERVTSCASGNMLSDLSTRNVLALGGGSYATSGGAFNGYIDGAFLINKSVGAEYHKHIFDLYMNGSIIQKPPLLNVTPPEPIPPEFDEIECKNECQDAFANETILCNIQINNDTNNCNNARNNALQECNMLKGNKRFRCRQATLSNFVECTQNAWNKYNNCTQIAVNKLLECRASCESQ